SNGSPIGGGTTGAWDPESGTDAVSEGKILGYGSLWITQSTTAAELQDALLDIHWYDTAAPAPKGNYTIVISCAASAYGDFFTGCNTNVMYVDDFEWVY
ncbi:MAG: PCMD domain-containing protein, partial [Alistipes sp.]